MPRELQYNLESYNSYPQDAQNQVCWHSKSFSSTWQNPSTDINWKKDLAKAMKKSKVNFSSNDFAKNLISFI